uniref:Uncharacterized protein n=1 Tax=Scytosiphon promiscuus TaxID=1403536 RepID=A0A6B7IKH5_9PHAE|nr:hypothetical protein SlomFM_096 [Scytosiphon promiscuus]QDM58382.1 hypothetical protein SlomFM_096 [Scytosiphon promiscuus]QDM58525.1 hypothetical protein SlomM_096 [Scytosiphon promiscuus]
MNIYFPATDYTDLNFPTKNLPLNTTESISNNENESHINIDQEDIEISEFYKKYGIKKDRFDTTASRKKLNKIKVYFLVKSKLVKGKEVQYAVPIRTFDDLGNSIIEKSNALVASFFHVKADQNLPGKYIEGRPGTRPFRLDHLIDAEPPFGTEEEVPLENFILPRKYGADGVKLDLPKDSGLDDPSRLRVESAVDEFGIMRSYVFFLSEYEYTDSTMDNTFLVNSSRYGTDAREKKSFYGEKDDHGFLKRIKEINYKEDGLKSFSISNILSLVFGSKSARIDKNIIPIFSKLEDAQDLLITVLEEINQPFQVRRKVEKPTTTEYYRSLDYLDDSFSLQNRYFFPNPESRIDQIKDFLIKYRLIKPRNISSASQDNYYNENRYQIKGPFFVEDIELTGDDAYVPMSQQSFAPKYIWRESDYWAFLRDYFPGQAEEYSWLESRYISESDKGLLQKSRDIKIVSMGLADFLEFWNDPTKKNAEVLFIPSSEKLNKKKLPFSSKKSQDQFYNYQQKFRGSKNQDTKKYTYEIKVSPK